LTIPTTNIRMGRALRAALLAVATAARAAQPQEAPPAGAAPRVRIVNPERDAVLAGRKVVVVLDARGVEIAPAVEHRPGTAHYDLFLDRDLTAADSAVPFWTEGIVHLSNGRSWHTYEALGPGSHRVIVVLVDASHVPLKPLVADTVHFALKRKP